MRFGVASAASTFILSEKDWSKAETEVVAEAVGPVGVPDYSKRGGWSCRRAGGALTAIPDQESRLALSLDFRLSFFASSNSFELSST